jgi:hypothetical protein
MYNNKRLALSIFWVVLGLVLFALSMANILDSSYFSAMGAALAVVGTLQVIRHLRYRKDKEYKEKIDIEVTDERNRFIRLQSWAWTGYIVVLIEAVGSIVAAVLGQETVRQVLSYSVCLIVCVYWIIWLVLSRKY